MSCPCFSGLTYVQCCAPFHRGQPAPNALALMRSRYSAYATGNINYIIQTTHPKHQDQSQSLEVRREAIKQFCKTTSFEGLEILESEEGESVSYVTFHAILKQNNQNVSFTEKSKFEKIDSYWFYLSGDISV